MMVEPKNFNSFMSADGGEGHELRRYPSFDDMPLEMNVLRGIYAYGFERPSAIQQMAIVPMIEGRDVIAQSQSGTGKTAVFCIAIVQCLDLRLRQTQALVLSPTRELALQTYNAVVNLAEYHVGRQWRGVNGHNPIQSLSEPLWRNGDHKTLDSGVMVAVGTPIRVADLINSRHLQLHRLKTVVLDEADHLMTHADFSRHLDVVFKEVPTDVQTCLFSATMPPDVVALADRMVRPASAKLKGPVRILVRPDLQLLEGIRQFYLEVQVQEGSSVEEAKLAKLQGLYETITSSQSIVFAESSGKVETVAGHLNKHGLTTSWLSNHAESHIVTKTFRAGSSRLLITMDELFGRGIDVQHVSLIVNYDLAPDPVTYQHRMGRCGRYGREGVVINFVSSPSDREALQEVESYYRVNIDKLPEENLETFLYA